MGGAWPRCAAIGETRRGACPKGGRKRKRVVVVEACGYGAGAGALALPGLPEPPQLSVRFLEQLGLRMPEGLEAGAAQTRGFTTKPSSASGGLSVGPDPSAPAQSLEASTGGVSLSLLNRLYLSSFVQFSPSAHPGDPCGIQPGQPTAQQEWVSLYRRDQPPRMEQHGAKEAGIMGQDKREHAAKDT